jgi:PAS domain S-box-containing protein
MAKQDELFGVHVVRGDATSLDGIANDIGILDAVDLPMILIGRDCTVARVNRAATTVLGLTASDIGRPPGNLLAGLENLDRLCAQVIADGAPCRREMRDGDRYFLLRITPYTGSDRQIVGAVLTFTNVTAFRASIDQAIYEREYTKAILNTVTDPLVVLDAKLRVQTANRAFYARFGVSRDETQGVSIRKLGNNEWETSDVWASIETTLSGHTEFKAVEIDREFPEIGRRTVLLDARRLARDGDALILLVFQDINERKQAERTTGLLAAIVDSSDDAIISKNLDGVITSWNKSAERLFGYTVEEAIGQRIMLVVPADRHHEEEMILERLRRGERVDPFETVRVRKDGTTLDISLTISPVKDAAGHVVGASKVARDVTERKRVERALAEQARLLDLSFDAIFVRDPADQITYWNNGARQLYGYTSEEAVGRVSHDLLRTKFPEALDRITEKLQRDRRWTGELIHKSKDGAQIVVASRWTLDQRDHGNGSCVLETNSDITQQKESEKALRESEERFRAIVETTPECVKLVAADGTLLHMNSPGLALVGADCAERVVGKNVYDLIAPEDRDRFRAFNEKVCRGEKGTLEFDIVGLEGTRRHMETHGAPLRDQDGTVVQLAVTRDITGRREAEKTRREAELSARLLQVQDEERRRIARELHDGVGQLLAAMSMNASSVIDEKSNLSSDAARCAEENFNLIQQVSKDIRTVSYLLHPPLLDEMGLHSALKWYVDGFAERSKIAATLELPDDLERLPREHELCLFRIAQECLTNIHRHSGSSTALVRLWRAPGEIRMEVSDEGRGLDREIQSKIASGQSAGVGLRGMQERVKQIGGTLRIHSNGKGASVLVALPLAEETVSSGESKTRNPEDAYEGRGGGQDSSVGVAKPSD